MKALSSCLGLLCLLAAVCAAGQEAGGDAEFADYQIRLFRSEKMFSSVRQGRVQRVRDLRGFTPADDCLLYTSPSPRDQRGSRMPSSA